MSLEEGFGGWVQGRGGVVFLWKMREKGKGVGGGGDRQRNRQVDALAFVKTTL